MFKFLLEKTVEIARKLNEDKIFIVSDTFFEGSEYKGLKIYNVPRKYSTYIESVLFSLEKEYDLEKVLSSEFIEKIVLTHHTSEYLVSLAYLSSIEITDNFIVLLNLNSVQGIFVVNPKNSVFYRAMKECSERISPEILRAVLNIAITLAVKGREGKKIGTAFIIGDSKEVMRRSRQLIINPFEGHPEERRNIKNPDIWETVREFSQLDGVFIIDEDGTLLSAGRYLNVSASDLKLRPGLGARHMACAAISQETEAISVVVSESGGDITVFKDGKEILKLSSILFA
jgi:DNA integrity scanning protein DisA with diadenylate cyclase activity